MKLNRHRIKTTIYLSAVVIVFVMVGVFAWLLRYQKADQADQSIKTNLAVNRPVDLPLLSPIPSDWKKEWEKEWERKMRSEKVEMEAEITREGQHFDEQLFSEFYPITDENREEIEKMLANFEPIEEKSVADIAQILANFYPTEYRDQSLISMFADSYRKLEDSDFSQEQKVLALVHFTQQDLALIRKVRENAGRREELKRLDPDAYYASEIQAVETNIADIEKFIHDAESKGDIKEVGFWQNDLAAHYEHIDSLKLSWKFATRHQEGSQWKAEIQEGVQQRLSEINKEYAAKVEALKLRFQEKLKERNADEDVIGMSSNASSIVSDTQVSPALSYDPARTLSSAQTSFRSWRVDLDEKYFDVVISRSLTAQEIDKYFPTAEDRAVLTRRTSEVEKLVVSQVRHLVKEIPDVKQKREITRELVTANFDKDFADNLLKALENDPE